MRTLSTVAEMSEALEPVRLRRGRIGLVPTMGAFHEGHLSLIRRARADCGVVVVSLFVNPSQFGAGEDLESYPRDLARDHALAHAEQVDVLFTPSLDEMYPHGYATTVEVAGLGEILCGDPARRGPGHFRGVATVVTKLLGICRPDVAYFGAKDFQQTAVIRRLVEDLNLAVTIEVCPTVRDPDGLALSSRNAYLSAAEREQALSLKRALDAAQRAAAEPGASVASVAGAAQRELEAAAVEPEYVQVLCARDLSALESLDDGEALIALAARIGRARLIDNAILKPSSAKIETGEKAVGFDPARQMSRERSVR
jgi:pantoate--beta-alanine ligase